MSNIGNDNSIMSKPGKNIPKNIKKNNMTASIITTEHGKNYMVNVDGINDTETVKISQKGGQKGGQNGSPPAPKAVDQKEPTVVVENADVNDILKNIKDHLSRFKQLDDAKLPTKKDSLKVGDNTISVECMLHFLSADRNFLAGSRGKCSSTIEQYSTGGKLDLNKLISLSADQNFLADSDFYRNLYGFNISMADFISKNTEFKNAKSETQGKLINNFQEFIKQSLRYLTEYMDKYNVTDDKLITSSYNLLYLLNKLTLRQVSFGRDITALQDLHSRLVTAVKQNIGIYRNIDISKISAPVDMTAIGPITQIEELARQLEDRLRILDGQQKILKTDVDRINADTTTLTDLATAEVKEIVV